MLCFGDNNSRWGWYKGEKHVTKFGKTDLKQSSKHFLKSVVYCIIQLSSLPMKSFLSYAVACDFNEKELPHFRIALKVFQNTV